MPTLKPLLVAFVAAWAIVTGLGQVRGAIQLRKVVDGDWVLVLDGAMAIVFGVALIVWPRLPGPALVWLVGWVAILLGSLYLAMGYWLRNPR